jgi:hypothetical protein
MEAAGLKGEEDGEEVCCDPEDQEIDDLKYESNQGPAKCLYWLVVKLMKRYRSLVEVVVMGGDVPILMNSCGDEMPSLTEYTMVSL